MLKEIREKAGFSQSQLANASNVNIRMIQQYEQGTRDINGAKLHTLAELSLILGCTISDILTDEDLIEMLKKVTL